MPTIQIGDSKTKGMYVGNSKIKEAWLGDTKLWSSGLGRIVAGNYYQQIITQAPTYGNMSPSSLPSNVVLKGAPYVAYGNNRFVGIAVNETGNSTAADSNGGYSLDGITWVASNFKWTGTFDYGVKFLGYINGYFIALLRNGYLAYSVDGNDWTFVFLVNSGMFSSIVYTNGWYYVSGHEATWCIKFANLTDSSGNATNMTSGLGMGGTCTNSDGSITVGYRGGYGFVKLNAEGTAWNVVSTLVTANAVIGGSAFGNGKFAIMLRTNTLGVYYTTNGTDWTVAPLPIVSYCISFDGSNFIVGCDNGYYIYSSDLVNWTVSPSPSNVPTISFIHSIAGN